MKIRRFNMKKAIIINGSPRPDGNSAAMCDFVAEYLGENNIDYERFRIYDEKFSPCIGCDVCHDTKTQTCVFQDAAADIIRKCKAADAVFVALPMYGRGTPGHYKEFQDRFYVEYDFAKNGFTKITSPEKKLVVAITYGGSPDSVAEAIGYNIAFAFQDLGYGANECLMFGDQRHKQEFLQSEEQQESVKNSVDWLLE
jgi:multimeric flavodoxin WrbA